MSGFALEAGRFRISTLALSLAVLCVAGASPARAATVVGAGSTFEVTYVDGATEGFNSNAAPVAGQTGNTGATLGEQRRQAFEQAVQIWADAIVSSVPIEIEMSFDPLPCSAFSGRLGQAGFQTSHRDWVTGTPPPLANTWYAQALANSYAGTDLSPANPDIAGEFNSSVGTPGCLTTAPWYYGFDSNPPSGAIDFMTVVLHEVGHGLGFATTTNVSSGALALGLPDAFTVLLEDHSLGQQWPAMSSGQRSASAQDTGDLHWVGAGVVAASTGLVSGRHASGHVQMYAPSSLQLGSSVVHFDTAVAPDEVMEPFITGANHDLGLTDDLLGDMGWLLRQCGNNIVESPEECDDGNDDPFDGCTNSCTTCGNGSTTAPEECDDNNLVDNDGCDSNCTLPACGNTVVNPGEDCDDGNGDDADACKNDCSFNVCGDGVEQTGVEECDDGDLIDGDGCDSNCTPTACGNGVATSGEECDDGDDDPSDGCTNWCTTCGNSTTTPPEQCDDGGLVDGDGCEARCIVTGQLPLTILTPPSPPLADSASVACLKVAGANSISYAVQVYRRATSCLNQLKDYEARQIAGAPPGLIALALAKATKACVEPSGTAPDTETMLGRLETARVRAKAAIELKCGTPGLTAANGRTIPNSASSDFSSTQIDNHLARVRCEMEGLVGGGYATAAASLATLSARPSQGGLPLDQSFSCLGPPELPAVDLGPATAGVPDSKSVSCQRMVGAQIAKAANARSRQVRTCLDAIQSRDAGVAAGLSPAQITRLNAAAVRQCVEPNATSPDSRTMLGKLAAAEVSAVSSLQRKCAAPGTPISSGGTVIAGSGDLSTAEIQTHVSTTRCTVDRLVGLAYNDATADLSGFNARASQGGLPLDQSFPCL